MELGACVCTPLKPACSDCPVRQLCHAANPTESRTQSPAHNERACDVCCPERQMVLPISDPKRYPTPKPKKTPREENVRVVVIEFRDRQSQQGEFFMRKRAENQVLANQWDFLVADVDDDVDKLVRQSVPLQVCQWQKREIGSVLHIFSHIRMTLHISHVVLKTDKRPEIPRCLQPSRRHCHRNPLSLTLPTVFLVTKNFSNRGSLPRMLKNSAFLQWCKRCFEQ